MLQLTRWKASVQAVASLYLTGSHQDVVRGVVKHLNILFNTQFALSPEVERAIAVLETLTKQIGAMFDHHQEDYSVAPDVRMTFIEMQLSRYTLQ
uniref:Uncharacterized protein n=1 Tax=Pseudomonas phage RVTF4 TaxID=3236931 RepID=A0AB39CDL5_9VIRU